jgi:hypothetical protein
MTATTRWPRLREITLAILETTERGAEPMKVMLS